MQAMLELIRDQLQQSISTLRAVLEDDTIADAVARAGELTARRMLAGGKLMVAGNGGSAAGAQHLAAEFVSRLNVNRAAMPAIALSTDTSILTAIGNDFAYDDIFVRQVEALGKSGDVLLALSTSGNSKNLIKALKLCRELEIATIGYTGNSGGAMADLCDINILIPSTTTMHIQESHLALEHVFCMVVERCYFGEEFDPRPAVRKPETSAG